MLPPLHPPPDKAPIPLRPPDPEGPLHVAARKLEAAFLAEMLKSAGLGQTRQAFGGGIGEEQFESFLREQQAMRMVEAGGIGLAQSLFAALVERQNNGV
jgi:peptidoglycan hydrolase FlgJ